MPSQAAAALGMQWAVRQACRTPEFSCNVVVAGKPRLEPKLHRYRARRVAPRAGPPPNSSKTSPRAYANRRRHTAAVASGLSRTQPTPCASAQPQAVDMWAMRWRAPARPVDNVGTRCPPPVPSPTCPPPPTTVRSKDPIQQQYLCALHHRQCPPAGHAMWHLWCGESSRIVAANTFCSGLSCFELGPPAAGAFHPVSSS